VTATRNEPATRLKRTLRTHDAVVLGLGSMIGAGIFAAVAPAARAAGDALLVGLAIAAVVAWLNASSVARLAAVHPQSGGAYVYGRERLGHFWGFLAGFGFIAGKLASCAAMAMTFASYAFAGHSAFVVHVAAACAAALLTIVNVLGVQKTMWMTRALVVLALVVLAFIVASAWSGAGDTHVDVARIDPLRNLDVRGVLESAGILFFAFAGYARIATLGEEVVDPARTIPRAIPIALALVLALYALVMTTALASVGAEALASSTAPLTLVVDGERAWVVRAGAAIASLGVLLSLLAGIGRTTFAMASNGDLPRPLAAVHERFKVPHRAEIVAGVVVTVVAGLVDVRTAIGFSSFCVLVYYAIANAAAVRLGRTVLGALGAAGCLLVAFTLPWTSVLAGACVLALGALVFAVTRRSRSAT
jgi:basic amino acid/polyamine antiporter, APA family